MKIFCLFVVALSHVTSFSNVKLRMSSTPFDILGTGLKSLKEVKSSNVKTPTQSRSYYEHPVRVSTTLVMSLMGPNSDKRILLCPLCDTCRHVLIFEWLTYLVIRCYDCDSFSPIKGLTDANTLTGFLWNEDTTRIYGHFDIRTRSYLWQRPSWHR